MFSYPASSVSKILRRCLKNVEQTGDPNDPTLVQLKHVLALRIAEAEARMNPDRSLPRD
jgi:hypothetical protein